MIPPPIHGSTWLMAATTITNDPIDTLTRHDTTNDPKTKIKE